MMAQKTAAGVARVCLVIPGVLVVASTLLFATGCAKSDSLKGSLAGQNYQHVSQRELANAPLAKTPKILPQTHYAAGRLFESQGQIGKAIEQYRKSVAVNHHFAEAYHRLGRTLSIANQRDDAVAALTRAVELAPTNAAFRNDLGFELLYHEQWASAEKHLRKAIELQPNLVRAHINLGLALSRTGRFDEALASFQAVLPEADAQYNLGLMFRGQTRYAEAATAFRRVLKINPEFTAARTQLDQLALHTDSVAPTIDAEPTHPEPFKADAFARIQPASIEREQIAKPEALTTFAQMTNELSRLHVEEMEALAREQHFKDQVAAGEVIPDGPQSDRVRGDSENFEKLAEAAHSKAFSMDDWESIQTDFDVIREILENDANCTREGTGTTEVENPFGGDAIESSQRTPVSITTIMTSLADDEAPATVRTVSDWTVVSPVADVVAHSNLRTVSDRAIANPAVTPYAPMETGRDRSVFVEAAPVRTVSADGDRFESNGSAAAPPDWRGAFADLDALARMTQNDYICARDAQNDNLAVSPPNDDGIRTRSTAAHGTPSGAPVLGAPPPAEPH